jgi:hypothetical protein
MNEIIKNKIYEENLVFLVVGIILLVGGIILNIVIYEFGWIITILLVVPFVGGSLFFYGIYSLIYYPSNPSYKCWENYEENNKNVDEVMDIIKEGEDNENSKDLIFSKKWIIQPSSLIFIKPKDINWAHLHLEGNHNDYSQKIKVFTNFGLQFEVPCSKIHAKRKDLDYTISEDVAYYLTKLKEFCKNLHIGFDEGLESLWAKDPENFLKNIKNN